MTSALLSYPRHIPRTGTKSACGSSKSNTQKAYTEWKQMGNVWPCPTMSQAASMPCKFDTLTKANSLQLLAGASSQSPAPRSIQQAQCKFSSRVTVFLRQTLLVQLFSQIVACGTVSQSIAYNSQAATHLRSTQNTFATYAVDFVSVKFNQRLVCSKAM